MPDHARHYAFPHAGANERRRLELHAERLDPLTVRRIKTLDGVGEQPFGAAAVSGGQCLRDAAQRRCLQGLVGEGVGDAFGVGEQPYGAVGVGGSR